jgi:hypothetical protein
MKKLVWKNMSEESRSILEWLESPVTDKKLTLTIKKNQVWSREWGNINVMVTEKIFDEIKQYVNQDDDIIMIEDNGDKLIFKEK